MVSLQSKHACGTCRGIGVFETRSADEARADPFQPYQAVGDLSRPERDTMAEIGPLTRSLGARGHAKCTTCGAKESSRRAVGDRSGE